MATNLTASTTQPDLKTYTGNCHCGAFKYTFQHEKITSGMQCNCSYCHKKGYLLLFLNKSSSNFSILRGEDSLKTYTFNTHNLLHKFCPTCGTNVIASSKDEGKEGTKNMAVNLRTVQDLGVWGLENMKVDGKSIGGTYTIPEPLEHGLKAEEGEKIYSGNCHCGKAKIVIKSKALSEVEARECDCSICMRVSLVLSDNNIMMDMS